MKQQFATALAVQPDNIFISSWNEFIAQPQPNPYTFTNGFSMGLEFDPQRNELFVDTYGAEFSRVHSIEYTPNCKL